MRRRIVCLSAILVAATVVAVGRILLAFGSVSPNPGTTTASVQQKQHYHTGVATKQAQPSLPRFLQEYIHFHNQHLPKNVTGLIGNNSTKFLIWQCGSGLRDGDGGCGGTGDRIKGIVSAFYIAVCSRRIFLIDWPGLSAYLAPHQIDWQIPPQYSSTQNSTAAKSATSAPQPITPVVVGKFKRMHSYDSPVLKDLQIPSRLEHHQMLALQTNRWYQDEMPDVHWYGGTHNASWYANQSQCLQSLWSQEGYNQHYSSPRYLFRTAFDTMFQLSKAVHSRSRQIQQDAKVVSSSSSLPSITSAAAAPPPYIAVHIRTGGSLSTFDDPGRHTSQDDYQKFYHCAKRIQQGVWERQQHTCFSGASSSTKDLHPRMLIYVASDDASAKHLLQTWDNGVSRTAHSNAPIMPTIRTIPDLLVYHIDKSHKNVTTTNHRHEGALTVWAELELLRKATCLVTSTSGFSQLANWLQQPQCAIHFEDCDQSDRLQQALDAIMENVEC